MLPLYFNYFSPIITLLASFFYIKGIIKGDIKPNKIGWLIWTLAPLVSSFIILENGGGISAIPVFMSWIIPCIVLLVSIKVKSEFKINWIDILCLIFAIIAIYLWLKENNIYLATIFAVIADGLGFIPSIISAWKNPSNDKPWPFIAGFFSALIALLTLKEYPFHLYGFPLCLMIGNLMLITVMYKNKKVYF